MKKRMAKLLTVLLVSASCLAGCGGQTQETAQTAETEVTEDTAESTEDAAAAEDTESAESEEDADQAAADNVAALIDAIYVQQRTDETDAQCEEAKAAWDALTEDRKTHV